MSHLFEISNFTATLLKSERNDREGVKYISKKQIDQNYHDLLDGLQENLKRSKMKSRSKTRDQALRLECEIMIKILYIRLMSIMEKEKGSIPYDKEIEKSPIREKIDKVSESVEKEIKKKREQGEENPRQNNEYRKIKAPIRAPISEVEKKYIQELTAMSSFLDDKIGLKTFTLDTAKEAEKLLVEKADAFELLCDPRYKEDLDEILLLNFDPNQEKLYIAKNMAQVTYISEPKYEHIDPKTGKSSFYQPTAVFQTDDAQIVIEHIGNLGYGRFRKNNGKVAYEDTNKIKDYKVTKKYSDPHLAEARKIKAKSSNSLSYWDDELDAEVFFVCGELNERLLSKKDVDKSLLAYTAYVTLSNTNLEQALEHNGGYIGEVSIDQEGEYTTYHDTDALCVAKEYEKVKKSGALKSMHNMKLKTEEVRRIVYQIDKDKLLIGMYDSDDGSTKVYESKLNGFPMCKANNAPRKMENGGR